jgi:Ca2+-binding RTX toxin-like protein
VISGSGDDILAFASSGPIYGGPGNDDLVVPALGGIAYGYGGDDLLTVAPHKGHIINPTVEFYGGDGDDTLIAGSGAGNLLFGGDGDDVIYGYVGWMGHDTVYGGSGNDWISASGHVDGGDGDDTIYGGGGGRPITSEVIGGVGNDFLSITNGFAYGGDGDDTLQGGQTAGFLTGGPGADLFKGFVHPHYLDLVDKIGVIADFNGAEGDRVEIIGGQITGFADHPTGLSGIANVQTYGSYTVLKVRFDVGGHVDYDQVVFKGQPHLETDYFI